jgi:hypothetical protein
VLTPSAKWPNPGNEPEQHGRSLDFHESFIFGGSGTSVLIFPGPRRILFLLSIGLNFLPYELSNDAAMVERLHVGRGALSPADGKKKGRHNLCGSI